MGQARTTKGKVGGREKETTSESRRATARKGGSIGNTPGGIPIADRLERQYCPYTK